MTKAERKSLWETRVAQYRASGQSASVWCAENKVSVCQLYYWLKKNGAQPAWIPVEIQGSYGESSLCVRVGRAAIEVKAGFDPEHLLKVVQTLTALC
ncbi:MAG: hypothetical protein KGZ64_11115 [Thermaerobacter sp.]|nr:hypothetical protein [Thermaerobacter sp.]